MNLNKRADLYYISTLVFPLQQTRPKLNGLRTRL